MNRHPNALRRDRRQWYKTQAKQRLGEGDYLFVLIIAALVLIMMTVSWTVIVSNLFAFFDFGVLAADPPADMAISLARIAVLLLGEIFLLMPLWYGLRGMGLAIMRGEDCRVGDLFAAFSTPRSFARVCRASLWIAWRAALSVALIYAMWYGVGLLELPLRWFFLPPALLLTPLLLFPLVGTHLLFSVMHIHPELGVFAALRCSTRLAVRSLGETLAFWGSFLGWFVLSFATAGVMLVLFVLPYFILADTAYVQYLLARAAQPITISTEEKNHVQ